LNVIVADYKILDFTVFASGVIQKQQTMPFFNHLIIPHSIKKIKFFIFNFLCLFNRYTFCFYHSSLFSLFIFRLIFLDYDIEFIYNLNCLTENKAESARRLFLRLISKKRSAW